MGGKMAEILSSRMMEILEARALDVELMVGLRLWSKTVKNPEGGGSEEALVIPYIQDGDVIHKKYRVFEPEKRHWQDGGGVKRFYNEDCLRDPEMKGKPLIITEGEPDTWAILTAAYALPSHLIGDIDLRKVVSVPDGAPKEQITDLASPKYSYVDAALEEGLLSKDDVPFIILATDADTPGTNLMHDLALRLGKQRCKFVIYPKCSKAGAARRERDKCKDIGEALEDWGAEIVGQVIERAAWMKIDGVYRMSELPPIPPPVSLEIGMPCLDKHLRLRLGDWTVSTGIPGMGKTTVMNDICGRIACKYQRRVAFASFEQHPQLDHLRNLRTWFCEKPVHHQERRETARADEWIDAHFAFLVPSEDDDVTADWLIDKMATAVIRFGVSIFVIDPWNEMDHMRERDETGTEYTGRVIKMMRRFAKSFHVHVHTIAHPTKLRKGTDGKTPVPNLYDIEGSAHWYNKADAGWVVHQNGDDSYVWVQKSRYHDDIGTPGAVRGTYYPGERRFDWIEDYGPRSTLEGKW